MLRPTEVGTRSAQGSGPLYTRVARSLRQRFDCGEYKPGDQLPSERTLMDQYAVSRVTIRRALRQLIDDQLLDARQGSGYTVRLPRRQLMQRISSFSEECRRRGLSPDSCWLSCTHGPCTREEAWRLKLSGKAPILRVQRVRTANGEPLMFEQLVLSGAAAIEPPWPEGSLYAALDIRGLRPTSVFQTYQAVLADAHLATALQITAGDPLMLVIRTGATERGLPVEYARCWCRQDRWTFAHHIGAACYD